MFEGHQIVKLVNDYWVYDFTNGKGYFVKLNNSGQIIEYNEAFEIDNSFRGIRFKKLIRKIPVRVIREAELQVSLYNKNMEE